MRIRRAARVFSPRGTRSGGEVVGAARAAAAVAAATGTNVDAAIVCLRFS
jgi:hypothetical protein